MFKSATVKLTAWYMAIVMAISIFFSIIVYALGTNQIATGIRFESQRIYNNFPVFESNPILNPKADISRGDHLLLIRLLFFNTIVLVFAGLASYLLAKRTLLPIEEAHEHQKHFTADVSHELRTPLTAIRMESEVALLEEDNVSLLKQTLRSNLEEITKIENLINNLLRLSKLESDELKANFNSIPLQPLLADVIKDLMPLAKQKKVKITNLTKTNVNVFGDRESLKSLMSIIVDNSVKYSPKSSSITIKLKVMPRQSILVIKDSGIGIDPEDLKHIFDRFYKSDSSRNKTDQKESFGLGLSIAKMIADLHDMNLKVSSTKGQGTEVKMYFNNPPKKS